MEDDKGSSSAETISPCVTEDSPASSTTCRSSPVAPQLPSEPPSPLVCSVSAVRSQSSSGVRRPLAHRAAYLWHGLPTAAKATLILAVASTVLLVAYGITAVSLRDHDEEAHISTVIIIISLFVLYAVFDAVIRENTLQLVSAIVLCKPMNSFISAPSFYLLFFSTNTPHFSVCCFSLSFLPMHSIQPCSCALSSAGTVVYFHSSR